MATVLAESVRAMPATWAPGTSVEEAVWDGSAAQQLVCVRVLQGLEVRDRVRQVARGQLVSSAQRRKGLRSLKGGEHGRDPHPRPPVGQAAPTCGRHEMHPV